MVKPTGPRVAFLLVAVALVSYTFVLAPKLVLSGHAGIAAAGPVTGPDGAASASVAPGLFPADGKTFIGVTTTEGTFHLRPVDTVGSAPKRQPARPMFSQGWARNRFDRTQFATA